MNLSYRTDPWYEEAEGSWLGPTEAILSYIARDYKGEPLESGSLGSPNYVSARDEVPCRSSDTEEYNEVPIVAYSAAS